MLWQRFLPLALALCACGEAPPPEATPLPAPAPAPALDVDAALPPPPVDRTIRRTLSARGQRIGTATTVVHFDGTRDTTIEATAASPRARLTTHAKVAADRTLVTFDARGDAADAGSAPNEEHFFLDGTQATWKGAGEQGTKPVRGLAFYVPLADDADWIGLLAEALIAAGDAVELLPEGEARIEKVGDATVPGPSGATKHLVGWRITGLSFPAEIAWMDDDGAFWGTASESRAAVPEGWDAAVGPLLAAAKALEDAKSAALAAELADKAPAAGLAITHARVLDVAGKKWLIDQTVVIKEGKIASVAKSSAPDHAGVPAGAETIDAAGKALIPGLWELRSAIAPSPGALYIASGVTSVRSGDEGAAIGPHVVSVTGREPDAALGVPWQMVASRMPAQARRRGLAGCADATCGGLLARDVDFAALNAASPADVLARWTIGAARAAKKDKTSGSVAAGKDADLVLIDGDPLKDLADLRYVVRVVRGGVVYEVPALLEAMGLRAPARPTP